MIGEVNGDGGAGVVAPPKYLRHTAGGRPSATLGTARHHLAPATPADRNPAIQAPSPRRTSMKPRKITLNSAPPARHFVMGASATLHRDLPRERVAAIERIGLDRRQLGLTRLPVPSYRER
jgi:hypothetical protein